jgi:hypothetical protein
VNVVLRDRVVLVPWRAVWVGELANHPCGSLTEQDAENYMAHLETEHRYRPDVWG